MERALDSKLGRRAFVRWSGGLVAGAAVGGSLVGKAHAATRPRAEAGESPYGPLLPADANGLRLPEGFSSRVLARSGQTVPGTGYRWHANPDGGAVFAADDGYVYVSNSEVPLVGGVGALRFDHDGTIVDAYPICSGTSGNCAGGKTPWGTWITCEEYWAGYAYECDPFTPLSQVRRPALGRFTHEAAAVDPLTSAVYLTEDEGDGCLYRFLPDYAEDLSSGELQVAQVDGGGSVTWHRVRQPSPWFPLFNPTRRQVRAASHFDGGEGIVYSDDCVFFTTKGDNRVWALDVRADTLSVVYDANLDPGRQLTGVDNITSNGDTDDLIVAEDGGNMELVLLTTDGVAAPLLRVEGQDDSELTGPAFDPTGTRLLFSSQRGSDGSGITYEVTGPFAR